MIIVRDTREQRGFTFDSDFYRKAGVQVQDRPLYTGDYSVLGLENKVAIERKSLDDLAATVTTRRERFEKEILRARGLDLFAVVVEGTLHAINAHEYRSAGILPQSVIGAVFGYESAGTHFVFAETPAGAEYATYALFNHYVRHRRKELKAIEKCVC